MTQFEWDEHKNALNSEKHGVSFFEAQYAFADEDRIIVVDITHSTPIEKRYYCIGMVGKKVLTVRFTFRHETIRIFGAGYWKKGKKIYDEKNS